MNKNQRFGASSIAIISTIVIVLVIIGAIYFTVTRETQEENESNTNSPVDIVNFEATPADGEGDGTENGGITFALVHTITYTDDGYSPKTLTIKAGEIVDFENNSSVEVWTASDVHPDHELLPEFDSLSGYKPGETYSFTFETPGSWTYHNHLNPSQTGIIIVQ